MSRLGSFPFALLFALTVLLAFVPAARAQNSCQAGYVPREAFPGDQVCVTPQTRAEAQADNRAAANRHLAGSDTCIQGFVWREASPQDHVCVTTQVRSTTAEDNRLASERMVRGSPALSPASGGYAPNSSQAPMRPGPQTAPRSEVLPAFHTITQSDLPQHARAALHPRPAPLTSGDFAAILPKLGLSGPIIPKPFVSTLKYQFNVYGNNSSGGMVQTAAVQQTWFAGVSGDVLIDFTAQPNQQYLLDCSLGAPDNYKVETMFFMGNTNNGPQYTSIASGQLSSFNGHLLVPLTVSPPGTQGVRVIIEFDFLELDGCQVDTVSQ